MFCLAGGAWGGDGKACCFRVSKQKMLGVGNHLCVHLPKSVALECANW